MSLTDNLIDDADDTRDDNEQAPEIVGPIADALDRAGFHVRRVANLRADLATVDEVFKREFERLNARYAERVRVINNLIDWHTKPLTALHARLLQENPKRWKSIPLPNGTLKSRTGTTPRFVIDDEETFVAWAREHAPDAVRVVTKPSLNGLKAIAAAGAPADNDKCAVVQKATGEVVPGASCTPPTTTFTIDTTGTDESESTE